MSVKKAQPEVESEFNEAVETARVYLTAVEVLDPNGSLSIWCPKCEVRIMRSAILTNYGEAVDLPRDPFARHAAKLGYEYLRHGRDLQKIEVLLERDSCHPAYREALKIVVSEVHSTGVDMPERLRRWKEEREEVKGRWRPEATRDYLIGLVIDAMEIGHWVEPMTRGSDPFTSFIRQQDKDRERLKRDWHQIYGKGGTSSNRLCAKDVEDIVKALNEAYPYRWGKRNHGRGLTDREFIDLLKQPHAGERHAIIPETEVRTSFPNLPVTRVRDTKFEFSLCDAVFKALPANTKITTYDTVVSAWKGYNKKQLVLL